MLAETFAIFRKFSNLKQATELRALLLKNDMDSELADNVAPVDVTFSLSTLSNQTTVRIKQADFIKAEGVLEKDAENIINEIDTDYYLFGFTDEELSACGISKNNCLF